MSDPFDYGDTNGLELELDLPSVPLERRAGGQRPAGVQPSAEPIDLAAPIDLDEPIDLANPFDLPESSFVARSEGDDPTSGAAADAPFTLELEDIAPAAVPVAQRPLAAARAAPVVVPQPVAALTAARTLEVRVAESVDRMSPFARGSLLALTIVSMVLLGVVVLGTGVRSARTAMEDARLAEDAETAAEAARYRDGDEPDDEADGADWD